ncbi:hypothetical protein M5K25_022709 [Dendrobium thyrsiflorum]|uniref:Uncharacterized protein n=1 Tax=Dendrobium thyrsiflorum TaxID=117978 RepID=A0ABD0U6Q4_DENTH
MEIWPNSTPQINPNLPIGTQKSVGFIPGHRIGERRKLHTLFLRPPCRVCIIVRVPIVAGSVLFRYR